MAANANWARWIFHSVADYLKEVATDADLPVLIEHFDERTAAFEHAGDKAEIRITGPFDQELSKGYHRIYVDANVLLTSRYDRQEERGDHPQVCGTISRSDVRANPGLELRRRTRRLRRRRREHAGVHRLFNLTSWEKRKRAGDELRSIGQG